MTTVIDIDNLGKRYLLGEVGVKTLNDELLRALWKIRGRRWTKAKVDDLRAEAGKSHIWAVRNLSLEINQGSIVGLIGKNGAGKSTVLKLISRITSPTEGRIRAKGRIASLLEVGTGFHNELTGRENIYLNGAIMGMRKHEIASKLEEIVEFSGCHKHIDTPVKRYSSGMVVRLGFAVAAHLESEIFIVDEVLAVGDSEFRRKSTNKLKELSTTEGRTILFVSHNMSTVKNLCTSGAVISSGKADYYKSIDEAVSVYTQDTQTGMLEYEFNTVDFRPAIAKVSLDQRELRQRNLRIVINFTSQTPFVPNGGVIVYNEELHPVLASNMQIHPIEDTFPKCKSGKMCCRFEKPPLRDGKYTISIWLSDKYRDYDIKEHLIKFDLYSGKDISIDMPVREYGSSNSVGVWSVNS